MRLSPYLIASALVLPACGAPVEPDNDTEPDPEPDVAALPMPIPDELGQRVEAGDEPIGEACDALECQTLCTIGAAIGCLGAWALCGAEAAVTIGGLAIPCVPLTIAACATATGTVAACAAKLCQ